MIGAPHHRRTRLAHRARQSQVGEREVPYMVLRNVMWCGMTWYNGITIILPLYYCYYHHCYYYYHYYLVCCIIIIANIYIYIYILFFTARETHTYIYIYVYIYIYI